MSRFSNDFKIPVGFTNRGYNPREGDAVKDDEDDRGKYDKADQGREWNGLGFLQMDGPHGSVETLPVPSEDAKEEAEKPSGKVIPSISPSDEMRLYSDLYASYGHPALVKAKALYAFTVTGVCLWLIYVSLLPTVAFSPLIVCALAGLAGAVGVAYILTNTAG